MPTSVARLHEEGHRQCEFRAHDLRRDTAIPGGPYDLVYARLVLFHLPERVAVLGRLWDAVAPGGHLVVQDYDLGAVGSVPRTPFDDQIAEFIGGAFTAAGCEVRAGALLPRMFSQAGVGLPDGDRRRRPVGPDRRRCADAGGSGSQPDPGRGRPRPGDRVGRTDTSGPAARRGGRGSGSPAALAAVAGCVETQELLNGWASDEVCTALRTDPRSDPHARRGSGQVALRLPRPAAGSSPTTRRAPSRLGSSPHCWRG